MSIRRDLEATPFDVRPSCGVSRPKCVFSGLLGSCAVAGALDEIVVTLEVNMLLNSVTFDDGSGTGFLVYGYIFSLSTRP